ncbi:Actin-binding LIM protein 2, partial [Ilyodon furcidens]
MMMEDVRRRNCLFACSGGEIQRGLNGSGAGRTGSAVGWKPAVEMEIQRSTGSLQRQKQPFPAGDRVTFNGKECICQKCTQPLPANSPAPIQAVHNCCGCGKEFKNEQSLVALDKHWHLGCFKCKVCSKVLNAEYISKDGIPFCEMDYHAMFGIQCESCKKYITGKVLE